MIRLHIGLEAVEDLIADLDAGFSALRAQVLSPEQHKFLIQ
jgi:hypothetical protein